MIAFSFAFPAGRYHATPWDRHANEADVAWPPEPARILRALIATWWRKAEHKRFPKPVLDDLIDAMAAEPPLFLLPDAVHAHIRTYMPAPERKALIYDGFLRFGEGAELIAAWPNVVLEPEQRELAAHLLECMGYLGRAEAWAEGRLVDNWDGEFNASPRSRAVPAAEDTVPVDVNIPVTPQAWADLRSRAMADPSKRTKKQSALVQATLPVRLADALAVDTGQWQTAGWSSPPPLVKMVYDRPHVGPLPPRRDGQMGRAVATSRPHDPEVGRFLLAGKPRPRIEDAIKIGELVRLAALAQFGRDGRDRWRAPPVISGRDPDGKPLAQGTHDHAFYLPEDADGDGFIDHVVIFAKGGLTDEVQSKLDRITRLWEPRRGADDEDDVPNGRKEWRLALEGFGRPADFADSVILGRSRCWRSVTPYLMPWHAKKNFGLADQNSTRIQGAETDGGGGRCC